LLLLVGKALLLPVPLVPGAAHASPPSAVEVSSIDSLAGMSAWLDRLHKEAVRADREGRFAFDLQEQILRKSGESISRLLQLEKAARLADPTVAKSCAQAFEKNNRILQFILLCNERTIERLQEDKLDQADDAQAVLESQEWQMPHRLNSLARYWMSWSGYYSSFLLPEDGSERKAVLDAAVSGFSLTLLDLADETIAARSLFGRALCFKEMGENAKAAKDLLAITQHVRQSDPMYIWSLYELALIRYREGAHEAALEHLAELEKDVEETTLSEVLGAEHKRLRERVLLEPRVKALLEKIDQKGDAAGEGARALYLEALRGLNRLCLHDAGYATRLYGLVESAPSFFDELTNEQAGAIGCLALADAHFAKGEYAEALRRYTYLWNASDASDASVRKRLDDVYFRSGYAYCRTGKWKEALASFDRLYAEFPASRLVGKAACLEYVAAAGNHRQAPDPASYARCVESSRKYLRKCPTPQDRDGAHFFLGQDYEKKGKAEDARREFSAIQEGSPLYWPARYYLLKADVEDLERRRQSGKAGAADTRGLYRDMVAQFEKFARLPGKEKSLPAVARIAPQMAILEARTFRSGPEASCERAIRALADFETRFPQEGRLWLTAMGLRLQCCRELRMLDEANRQIDFLLQAYPVDRDLWDFLAEWAEAYDQEAEMGREEGSGERGAAWADLALKLYTGMAAIASRQPSCERDLSVVEFRMAELLRARGDLERARRIYSGILKLTPDAEDVLFRMGEICETQGRWEEALEVWRRYEKGMEPGSPAWLDAKRRIALAHEKMGRRREACEVITMIRVLHPEGGDEALREKILDLEKTVCPNAVGQDRAR
jgi:tetratricopeptide (TPR) repeat protein